MPTPDRRRKTKRRAGDSARGARAAQRIVVQRAVRGAPASTLLRAAARAAAPARARLTLRIVGAAEARRMNRTWRRRDYATNVLSFDYGAGAGDVALCHPVIAREARTQGKRLAAHYAHLVVHAVLHLRGHDHARVREAARMERAEARILARLGYENPYEVEWRRRSPRRR